LKTASSKQKGRLLQQVVRDKILEAFPRLEKDDVVSTSMGASGADVQLSPTARRSFPYSVEAKSRATISTYKWYDQAVSNTKPSTEPLLVIKANRRKPLVVIDLDAFMELVK
jgi:hypothetical protein